MNWVKFLFFFIFYILLGTTGISIPCFLNGFIESDISIGLVTIVISTVGYSSTEKILQLYDNKSTKLEVVLNLGMMVLFLLCTIVVAILISKNNENVKCPLWIACGSYIISCVFWWYQNRNNKNLTENNCTSALGGAVNQQ